LRPSRSATNAEHDSSECGGDQRDRAKDAGGALRELQYRIGQQRSQHDRVEHDVERIEHPAKGGGNECAPRANVGFYPPVEKALWMADG
jgi:hypothetical protein